MAMEHIIARFDTLIKMGEEVLCTRESHPSWVHDIVDGSIFQQWRTSSLALIKSKLGEESVHYQDFESRCKSGWYSDAQAGLAVLKAAKEDIEGGYLQRVEQLVSADVFSDFLDMAEHLVSNGYKDAAASLIGAVLENGLRRISKAKGVTLKAKEDIGSLNQKLADAQIYNRLQQRNIQVWKEIRDNADHGQFGEYNIDNVRDMLRGVRDFLGKNL